MRRPIPETVLDSLLPAGQGSGGTPPSAVSGTGPHALTMRAILDFESAATELRLSPQLKARWIREDFGCSTMRFYQALVNAIAQPDAAIYAPALVARLRRLREQRRALRVVDRLDGPARPSPSSGRQRSLTFGRER